MAQLEVDLVAADGKVWSGKAKQVSAPAADGEIGILAGHSPLLSVLRAGRVSITAEDGRTVSATISGGFISVDDDDVTVVVNTADLDVAIGASGRG